MSAGKLRAIASALLAIFIAVVFVSSPAIADDDSDYYSNLSQDEINQIFELKTGDLKNPWAWLSDARSYVVIKDTNGKLTYFWNAPNIQMSLQNSLYGSLAYSGYGNGTGTLPEDRFHFSNIDYTGKDGSGNPVAATALEQYGFNIPSPSYVGERPLITISVEGVLLPDNPGNAIGRLVSLVFDDEIVAAPTNKDMNSFAYLAPRDYGISNTTFENWVAENWYTAIANMDDGQILLSSADQSNGEYQGKYWVKENIINQSGLNVEGLSASRIVAKLKDVCGFNFQDVVTNIILASGITDDNVPTRLMPYDLTTMSDKDAQLFDGVTDPRADMQKSLYNTGYDKNLTGMFKSWALSASSGLADVTVSINDMANFSFLDNIGFNPSQLWAQSLIKVLFTIMMAAFLIWIVIQAVKFFAGRIGAYVLIGRVASTFFVALFVAGLMLSPDGTYNLIRNTSATVFNISSTTLQSEPQLEELYGTGTPAEKAKVDLWLPYFDSWTVYNTNHSLLDPAQTIDVNSGDPESDGVDIPAINGIAQNKWSTILAGNFSSKKPYSREVYRVVDHFMAPRLNNFVKTDSSFDFDIKTNSNYNGNIQSSFVGSQIPAQILLLVIIVIKLLLFIEFIFNIGLLVVNLSLTVLSKNGLVTTFKTLGASMLNVAFAGIAASLVVWLSLISSGVIEVLLTGFIGFVIYVMISTLMKSNSVFAPKIFRFIRRKAYKAGRIARGEAV